MASEVSKARETSLSLLCAGALAQHPWQLKGTWDTASTAGDALAIHMTLLPASTPEGCKVLLFNRSLGTAGNENTPFRVRTLSTQFLAMKASGFDYQTFKVYLEQKASRSLSFTLKARNYDTQQFDTLGTGTVSTSEIGQEFAATEVLPPGRQPYVDPVTRDVKLQIGYSDTSGGFSVFLDRVEVRSR